MISIIDLKAEFARLKTLQGRTPTSSEAEREGAFGRVAPYRDGAIFTAKFSGTSAWERHPGDEIVQIVDGATTLHLITEQGEQHSLTLNAGMLIVVPRGAWHQFEAPNGVCVMTATPQPTEHLRVDVADPRTVAG